MNWWWIFSAFYESVLPLYQYNSEKPKSKRRANYTQRLLFGSQSANSLVISNHPYEYQPLILHFIISVGAMIVLVNLPFYNFQRLINDNDFYYNCITLSSIIGGFLFTGISILISALDKDRIKRLWENNYLDNLYRSAFVGIILNVISIFVAVFLLCTSITNIKEIFLKAELVVLFVGIIFFIWCIRQLIFVLTRLKRHNTWKIWRMIFNINTNVCRLISWIYTDWIIIIS